MIGNFFIFATLTFYSYCIVMLKKCLILSTSSELVRVAPENIVYFEADGNYCFLQTDNDAYVNNRNERRLVSFQLGQIEAMIEEQLGVEGLRFIRIGRSLIINLDFVYYIHTQRQKLFLADGKRNLYEVEASRDQLKRLKEEFENNLKEELAKKDENPQKPRFFHKQQFESEKEDQL